MSKTEDKHLSQIAAMHAVTDYSWHGWNSALGLAIGLIGIVIFLNGLVIVGILIKFLFLMK